MVKYELTNSGMDISSGTSKLVIPSSDLFRVTVDNCLFRLHGRCPHCNDSSSPSDLGDTCPEMVSLFLSLSVESNTFSEVLEKYHLFVTELQASSDYREFISLTDQVKQLESEGVTSKDLELLEMKRTAAKVWWDRLTTRLVRDLGRVNDRASRSENVDKMAQTINLSQIHRIANNAKVIDHD